MSSLTNPTSQFLTKWPYSCPDQNHSISLSLHLARLATSCAQSGRKRNRAQSARGSARSVQPSLEVRAKAREVSTRPDITNVRRTLRKSTIWPKCENLWSGRKNVHAHLRPFHLFINWPVLTSSRLSSPS